MRGNRFFNIFAFLTPVSPVFALVYYGLLTTHLKRIIKGSKDDKLTRYTMLAIIIVGTISAFLSQNVTNGILNSFTLPLFIGIYALGRWGIAYPREFLKALTLGAGLLGIIVILGWLFKTNIWIANVPILTNFDGRGNVLGVEDNGLAAMLEVGVTGGLGLFMYQARDRWVYLVSAISALTAIFITLSRGSMVATAAAIALLVIMNRELIKKHWKVFATLVLVLGLVVMATPRLSQRIVSIFDIGTEAGGKNAGRFEIWTTTFGMVKDHALFGVGPGQFGDVYREYMRPNPIHGNVRSPHSLYLFILSGWGLLGLLTFLLWAVGSVVLPVIKKPSPYRKIALAIVASFFVHVIFNDLFVAHVPLVMGVIARPELDDETV